MEMSHYSQSAAGQPLVSDFRLLLQQEFSRRCRANPQYSLRAFAKFLGVDGSRLSKILRGERPVRGALLVKFAEKLQLPAAAIAQFKTSPATENRDYRQISLDAFASIEDWRHYAILELMKVQGFEPSEKWIAKQLGLARPAVRAYLERLQRVGLLEINARGEWRDTSEGFSTHILSANETTYAHRRSQRQILALAQEALEQTPIEQRDQSSIMMATSRAKLQEAKLRIQKFRRELCDFLEAGEEKDAVYQLSLSLFPLVSGNQTAKGTKK
jgi:transcriptional regulator with XRE-family HTH domain